MAVISKYVSSDATFMYYNVYCFDSKYKKKRHSVAYVVKKFRTLENSFFSEFQFNYGLQTSVVQGRGKDKGSNRPRYILKATLQYLSDVTEEETGKISVRVVGLCYHTKTSRIQMQVNLLSHSCYFLLSVNNLFRFERIMFRNMSTMNTESQ